MKKAIILSILLYLAVGIGYQVYNCAVPQLGADGMPSDIPCAGIVWTPIILLGWPLVSLFFVAYGDILKGLIQFALVLIVVSPIFLVLIRRHQRKNIKPQDQIV